MIDAIKLRRLSVDEGVPLGTIEKDLAVTCALYALSKTFLKNHLIFKGGTAIKKIYQPDARFSEDMDFTVTQLDEEDALEALSSVNDTQVDSIFFEKVQEDAYTKQGKNYRLVYTGPLDYRNSVRLDLSFRADIIGKIEEKKINAIYGDALASSIKALSFIEIMSEKLRAIITRESPRDYYDAWTHLPRIRDKHQLRKLTEKKCAITGYEYDPANILDQDKLLRVESSWKTRLHHLVPYCPEFKDILPDLTKELKFLQK